MAAETGAENHEDRRLGLLWQISRAFSPAAPIDRRELFAGRVDQVTEVIDVIYQPGQHAVLYGERGVGKTSLARVMAEFVASASSERNILAPRANCDSLDDFSSIWRKVLDEIKISQKIPAAGFRPQVAEAVQSASSLLGEGPVTPEMVRQALQVLGSSATTVVFVDEFDRIEDPAVRTLFADTVKTLSDNLVRATLVLVGVADNVDELISEHQSIERNLVQIHMQRMSKDELKEIVTKGLTSIEMTIEPGALESITQLSQGLPHYTHLLAQNAARSAVDAGRMDIGLGDVADAVKKAIRKAQESIINLYHRAILSTRENLYEQVLLACALAQGDELGYFAAADVRDPLSKIMKRRYEIPAFARHLNALSDKERGPVLHKKGVTRRFRYRFLNPLIQPYVIMRGLSSEMITPSFLGE